MRKQRQRKTYYVKQTIKQRETPIYNAEMLNKTKRNKQHSTTEKNIKTDINNEERLAKKNTNQRQKETLKKQTNVTKQCEKKQATRKAHKKTSAATENKTTIENHTNVGKQHKKHRLTQKCWKMQTAVKNWTKRRNRRTQQTQSRQPPDNDKMIDEGNQQNHAQGAQTAA